MTPPTCPECNSTSATKDTIHGRVPPGHPIFSLVVMGLKAAQSAGVYPAFYTCNKCKHRFVYACGHSM